MEKFIRKVTRVGKRSLSINIPAEIVDQLKIIAKMFEKTGGDFDHPTKESLVKALDGLAEFSKNFRNQEVVDKHYNEIKELVDKLD
jgi:uncharacterized protein YpuA (DUF1002 family)